MKTVCSWCGRIIANKKDANFISDNITHGLCRDCQEFVNENVPVTLSEFISRLEVTVLVVDSKGRVVTANQQTCTLFNKDISQVENQLGGNVMECAYARLPGGCGNTIHCTGCTIRQTVMKTFETGRGADRVEAYQDIMTEQGVQCMTVIISTLKLKDTVLLKIDKIGSSLE